MIQSTITATFPVNIEILWNIITNNQDYTWRSDLSKINIIDDTHFVEYTKQNFPTYFTITNKKKLSHYEFDLENKNIKGHWIGILKKIDENTTEICFTEQIQISSPIMKVFAKSYLKKQQNLYIHDLQKKYKYNYLEKIHISTYLT